MEPLLEHFRVMARYNRWMNDKLYALAAELPDASRRRDLGAFFGSLHGTLNHLLLGDRIWLGRLGAAGAPAFTQLSDELYADFDELRREHAQSDELLASYVASLDAEKLSSTLDYTFRRGRASHPTWFALSHLFNHQTHHRGQTTTLLMQLGKDPGLTDVIAVFRGEVG